METWQVVREIYWCEKNNKIKWLMYLLTDSIKLVCTLSFTLEGNCGTNLKALLECMNKQYFFPFYTKIKKKKVKFQNLIYFVVGVWLDDFPFKITVHYLLMKGITYFNYHDSFPVVSILVFMIGYVEQNLWGIMILTIK